MQNVSQAPSMWIKINKWNYLRNISQEFKNSFILGSYEYLERLTIKLESVYSFVLKYSKITLCPFIIFVSTLTIFEVLKDCANIIIMSFSRAFMKIQITNIGIDVPDLRWLKRFKLWHVLVPRMIIQMITLLNFWKIFVKNKPKSKLNFVW